MSSIRARYLKEQLVFAATYDADQPPSAYISDENRRRVDQATTADWMPMDVLFDMARRTQLALGPTRFGDFTRQVFLRQVKTPLLRPILFAAQAVFHVGPSGLLKHLPAGWAQTYKNLGQPRYEKISDDKSLIVIADVPAAYLEETPWLDGCRHAFGGIYDLVHTTGTVTLTTDPAAKEIRFAFTT